MTLPVGDIASARIYVHCGGNLAFNKVLDANGKSKIQPAPSDDAEFNFVEFTITAGRIYVDISAVDMVARPSRKFILSLRGSLNLQHHGQSLNASNRLHQCGGRPTHNLAISSREEKDH